MHATHCFIEINACAKLNMVSNFKAEISYEADTDKRSDTVIPI